MSLGLPDRIERNISPEPNTGCWLWMGGIADKREGYGVAWYSGQRYKAHRLTYELLVGPIPAEYTIDHKCRVRCCVNPDHLEAVTRTENVMRGEGACAKHARKTHCPQGHEYTPENTYLFRTGRHCRTCHSALTLAAYHKRKNQK